MFQEVQQSQRKEALPMQSKSSVQGNTPLQIADYHLTTLGVKNDREAYEVAANLTQVVSLEMCIDFLAALQITLLTSLGKDERELFAARMHEHKPTLFEMKQMQLHFDLNKPKFSGGGAFPNLQQIIEVLYITREQNAAKIQAAQIIEEYARRDFIPKLPRKIGLSEFRSAARHLSIETIRNMWLELTLRHRSWIDKRGTIQDKERMRVRTIICYVAQIKK
jgi:hypothetical protein